MRALAEEQPSPAAHRDLALALSRLGNVVEALDGSAAAVSLYNEMTELMWSYCEPQSQAQSELIHCLTLLLRTLKKIGNKEDAQVVEANIAKIKDEAERL